MKKEKKIQDYDWLYSFLRYYVDFCLKLSYRNVRYEGLDRIPRDGAVIYAPNHTNALMDALVILAMNRSAKVFVARADIFRNPTLAKIFRFLKIMPIMRMRDGIDEVKRNSEIISKSVDVLRDRVPFCIFPEGTHQTKYSSLPLSKGIFRIAFQAQDMMPDMPLYIVPVGIRYGSFFRFRSTVYIKIGEPIHVGEFLRENASCEPQVQINMLRDILAERMKRSIFYIPNDEDYNATYEICAAVVKQRVRQLEQQPQYANRHPLEVHFDANNLTVQQITQMKEQAPERTAELLKLGQEASELRKSKGISLASVSIKYPFWSRLLKFLVLIVALPYCLAVSILTLPIAGMCRLAFMKLKDRAFRNSVRFLLNLVLWPLLVILYSVVAGLCLPWQWVLPTIIAILPAPIVAHEIWRLIRLMISDIRLLMDKRLREKYRQIRAYIFNK